MVTEIKAKADVYMKNVIFFRTFISYTPPHQKYPPLPALPKSSYHVSVLVRNFSEIAVNYSCKNCTGKKALGIVQSKMLLFLSVSF